MFEIHDIVWEAADAKFDGTTSASSSSIVYDSGVVALKLPTNLRSVAFVKDGDIKQVNSDYEAGKPTFSGVTGVIDGVDLSGDTLYFYGTSGDTLHIRYRLFN